MFRTSKVFMAAALAVSLLSLPQAEAQQNALTIQGATPTVAPGVAMNRLRAAAGQDELKCTGPTGHKTCTSKYAWVCPSGWHACSGGPKGGTCCTQD